MNWMQKILLRQFIIMAPDDDKGGGGGGGGPDAAALAKENADLKAKVDAYEKAKADDEAKKKDKEKENNDDLATKAAKEREAAEAKAKDSKAIEHAVKFNSNLEKWTKDNATLLPKNMASIIEQANKEKYDSEIQKANDIKVAVVQEFFAQQSNLDLLTDSQKELFADFKNLTKNVKQERVQQFYDSVFEPTLGSLSKIRKAEALQKGLVEPSNNEDAYTKKLMEKSQQHHFRGKK